MRRIYKAKKEGEAIVVCCPNCGGITFVTARSNYKGYCTKKVIEEYIKHGYTVKTVDNELVRRGYLCSCNKNEEE